MKIIIISDSHGNIANIKLVLGFAKKIKVDGIIHCGDWDNLQAVKIVYSYNSIQEHSAVYCGDELNADMSSSFGGKPHSSERGGCHKIPVYGVLGNADIDPRIAKIVNGQWLMVNLGGRKIGVVHDFNSLSPNILISQYPSIVFSGHRHFKSERIVNGVKVVSPGALHSVKPSFAVYDTVTNGVEFFDL